MERFTSVYSRLYIHKKAPSKMALALQGLSVNDALLRVKSLAGNTGAIWAHQI